jgi:hypothetical protein
MPSTNSHLCAHCLQPLIYIKFSQHYRIVCDNYSCILFRERQGIIPRNNDEPEEKPKKLPSARVMRRDYQAFRGRGKRNYHFARSLNIPSAIARNLRNKSKKEIERVAKELVRV